MWHRSGNSFSGAMHDRCWQFLFPANSRHSNLRLLLVRRYRIFRFCCRSLAGVVGGVLCFLCWFFCCLRGLLGCVGGSVLCLLGSIVSSISCFLGGVGGSAPCLLGSIGSCISGFFGGVGGSARCLLGSIGSS